jgi:hypothetical protein
MDTDLHDATREVLEDISITRPLDDSAATKIRDTHYEAVRLKRLYELKLYEHLVARIAVLVEMGWAKTDIADAVGVSRVSVDKWLVERSFGAQTFTELPDILDPDTGENLTTSVYHPVTSRLTKRQLEQYLDAAFKSTKFIVPPGYIPILQAMWRIAYRARRGSPTDADMIDVANALDVIITLLLRRGVSNLEIARAAGVTHRAVLDRVIRVQQRGGMLNCSDDHTWCEAFLGEDLLHERYGYGPTSELFMDETLNENDWITCGGLFRYQKSEEISIASIRMSKVSPSRHWTQILMTSDRGGHDSPRLMALEDVRFSIDERRPKNKKILQALNLLVGYDGMYGSLAGPQTLVEHLDNAYVANEMHTAAMIGRMTDDDAGHHFANLHRTKPVLFIPANLLYVQAMVDIGMVPMTTMDAVHQIPDKLWDKYFKNKPLVQRCIFDTSDVLKEWEPTTGHKPDAKTRTRSEV